MQPAAAFETAVFLASPGSWQARVAAALAAWECAPPGEREARQRELESVLAAGQPRRLNHDSRA